MNNIFEIRDCKDLFNELQANEKEVAEPKINRYELSKFLDEELGKKQ